MIYRVGKLLNLFDQNSSYLLVEYWNKVGNLNGKGKKGKMKRLEWSLDKC